MRKSRWIEVLHFSLAREADLLLFLDNLCTNPTIQIKIEMVRIIVCRGHNAPSARCAWTVERLCSLGVGVTIPLCAENQYC